MKLEIRKCREPQGSTKAALVEECIKNAQGSLDIALSLYYNFGDDFYEVSLLTSRTCSYNLLGLSAIYL